MHLGQIPEIKKTFDSVESAKSYIMSYLKVNDLLESNDGLVEYPLLNQPIEINKYSCEDSKSIVIVFLKIYQDSSEVEIYRNYKHKMITAAILGDIVMFSGAFDDSEIMINLSGNFAIQYKNVGIINYIYKSGFRMTNDPIYRAIIYDNPEVLDVLLANGVSMKENWFIQAIQNKSYKIISEYFFKRKFEIKSQMNSNYFQSTIQSDYERKSEIIDHLKKHYNFKYDS